MFKHALSSLAFRPRVKPASTVLVPWLQTRKITSDVEASEGDYEEAREWMSSLKRDTIPRKLVKVRFDRSSGKGGQHVNTTSSKATCTWSVGQITAHIPKILHQELRKSTYYAPKSDTLVISSQESRSQHDNEEECHEKLYNFLRDVSRRVIPGEPSLERRLRAQALQKSDNLARLRMKKHHSDKKKARKGS